MATSLLKFADYAEYRALLGVDSDELADDTLALRLYSQGLEIELADVDSGVLAAYDTVLAVSEAARTQVQQRLFLTCRMFAIAAVGRLLCTALPLFQPKSVTDGKAGVTRYSDSPYKETIEYVETQYARWRSDLGNAYQAVSAGAEPAVVLRSYMTVASPTSDPVTGA